MEVTRLKQLREERALSQRDLAKLSGVTFATISRLETGKHKPTFASIRKLAAALGVEPKELY